MDTGYQRGSNQTLSSFSKSLSSDSFGSLPWQVSLLVVTRFVQTCIWIPRWGGCWTTKCDYTDMIIYVSIFPWLDSWWEQVFLVRSSFLLRYLSLYIGVMNYKFSFEWKTYRDISPCDLRNFSLLFSLSVVSVFWDRQKGAMEWHDLSRLKSRSNSTPVSNKLIQRVISDGLVNIDDLIKSAWWVAQSEHSTGRSIETCFCMLWHLCFTTTFTSYKHLHVTCTGDLRAVLGQVGSDGNLEATPTIGGPDRSQQSGDC